jgi:hypothetical protein
MIPQLLYIFFFLLLGAFSFYTMATGWRRNLSGRDRRVNARTHPELLDRQGRMIRDPLLVVRVTPRDPDIRSQLEALYNNSPDTDERKREN